MGFDVTILHYDVVELMPGLDLELGVGGCTRAKGLAQP